MSPTAFYEWWRRQGVPPHPTPAQLRAWCRRAWEAGARAARDGTAIARGNDPEPDVSPASLPHGGDPPCPRP